MDYSYKKGIWRYHQSNDNTTKENTGFRNFLLRGLQKAKGEFNLMCIGHNLKKIYKFLIKDGTHLAGALKNYKKMMEINTKSLKGNSNGARY